MELSQTSKASLKRSRLLFTSPPLPPSQYSVAAKKKIAMKVAYHYPIVSNDNDNDNSNDNQNNNQSSNSNDTHSLLSEMRSDSSSKIKNQNAVSTSSTSQLSLYRDADFASSSSSGNLLPGQSPLVAPAPTSSSTAITARSASNLEIPTPSWHPSWKIHSVISGHLGWVRSVAFDPGNEFFVTGSADRTIKVWDFAKASVAAPDALKLTLTGHINAVRGLAISPRHPYMFSCGEDKMVKCWDLEYNKVIRQYHGHLSGVFCLKLHPTLDILITGGRDACARVWDMRTKEQIHCLGGHEGTVASILTNGVDPQVVTGGHDSKVKLWDLAAGKVMTTLTHHKKSVRALASHPSEFSFMSAGADNIKKWQGKDGRFIQNFPGHNAVVNAMTCNADGVLVSGGDDGSMRFWDYKTGYQFQAAETVVQPGSLEAEKGIYALAFDETGTRLVTCEADKTIKIWSEDKEASEVNEPIDKKRWRKQCIAEARSRY